MDQLNLARIQFASTSIYHFFFVPVTMGLAVLVAILHTRWYRTGNADMRRLTRFFGGLMLISIAVGVVTGLVQEFQFGMDWSQYSRFVGDVFGAPLAMEGLAAFFLESTFLGLWLFGWNVLPRGLHLLSAWLIAVGACLSAAFIIAANSWMQNPRGYTIDPATGRAQLTSITDVFTNPVFIWGYVHVLLVALIFGGATLLSVSAWHLRRGRDSAAFHKTAVLGLFVFAIASVAQFPVGGRLGINETTYQPMKIAAAEANWQTCQPCSFSVIQIGGYNQDETPTKIIEIPHLLSLLATGSWDGEVQGLGELNTQYNQQYGPGYYVPNVFVQYWSMRVMAYLAMLGLLVGVWGAILLRRKLFDTARFFLAVCGWVILAPFAMATAGWLLTESGRQPWIVQGLMLTKDGLSGSGSATQVAISLSIVVVLYTTLGVIAAVLMVRSARKGLPPEEPAEKADDGGPGAVADRPTPSLTY
jgi:cytochrome d ubiquinol oxidase subunit I